MAGVTARPPQRPDRELDPETAELAGTRSSDARFVDALLHQADLSDARLPHLELRNCSLRAPNLANLQARGATLERVAIESGRLTGVRLVEARLTDVVISGCRVDLASFGGTRMERVTFEDCQMAQTDFLEATLDGVRFDGCDLRAADFRGARLRNTEFRRCELIDLLGRREPARRLARVGDDRRHGRRVGRRARDQSGTSQHPLRVIPAASDAPHRCSVHVRARHHPLPRPAGPRARRGAGR